jgi:hypothetical protein
VAGEEEEGEDTTGEEEEVVVEEEANKVNKTTKYLTGLGRRMVRRKTRTLLKIGCRFAGNIMGLVAAGHTVTRTTSATNNRARASAAKARMLLASTLRANRGTPEDTETSPVIMNMCCLD